MTPPSISPPRTVLLVDGQEWTSRSLESILRPRGYTVLKAFTGRQALELARRMRPDLVVVDFHLPDMDGIDLLRQLKADDILDPVTPLLMLSSTAAGKAERLEALGAGAWDILSHPLDPGELLIRFENLLGAKGEADRLRSEITTDPATGVYNVRGLIRRVRELSADSARNRRPMACLVVGPDWDADPDAVDPAPRPLPDHPEAASLADALRAAVRASDPVGRLGPKEFVVVLSGVDREKAAELAGRIMEFTSGGASAPGGADALTAGEIPREDLRLRVGISVSEGESDADPERLLTRATLALRRAQAGEGSFRVQTFDA